MGTVNRLATGLCVMLSTLAWHRGAAAYHLEDTLRGATRGNPVGGSFAPDGWHVTARTDRIWYALPRLASGSVEFTLSNVTMASLGDTSDNEIFAMYEAGYGIAEPIRYAPEFRENNYKCMLRVYSNGETGRAGQQKLMWGLCPGGAPGYGTCACSRSFFDEPFGGDGTWDGSPQRIRVEWGGGRTRYLRNGTQVIAIDWSSAGSTFGPSELHLSLGTSRPSAVDTAQLPVGAIFSDLVVDGTEGALATCPSAPVPDAGAPFDSGSMTMMGNVVTVPAIEDVTVDPAHATTVYPDVNDLAVGAGDSEFYVKFRVGPLAGRVTRAELVLHSATSSSAVGTGASVFTASSSAWSETTLAWNARPRGAGPRIGRIDGVEVDQTYTVALPASAVTGEGTWAFAVLPEATDTNSAHFDSKEVSAARGPMLRLTINPTVPPVDASMPVDATVAPDVPPSDASRVMDVPPPDVAALDATVSDAVVSDVASNDVTAIDGGDAPSDVSRPEVGPDEVFPEAPSGGCGCRARTPSGRTETLLAIAMAFAARRRQRRG